MISRDRIRNLSIISHIDHGKTTLSDRILELTGAVDARDMREQYLDSMDLERERGITIKAQNVRLPWKGFTDAPLQALIFDSMYDQYRGVISAVRVFNGVLSTGSRLRFIQAGAVHDADEVGVRAPALTPIAELGPGEVGYLVAGIKDVS